MANLCNAAPRATGIIVGTDDDIATRGALVTLASTCSITTQEALESDGTVVNSTTGQPIARGGLLVAFGGDFFQHIVGYAESEHLTPVYTNAGSGNVWQFIARSTAQPIVELAANQVSSTHDVFVIELIQDPQIGVPIFLSYGIDTTGTSAAAWYFTNVVAPNLAAQGTNSWYVVEWSDTGAAGPSDLSEFVLRGSGGPV